MPFRNYSDKRRQVLRRRKKIAKWLKNFKKTKRCKCGENHPACLEFHHKQRSSKKFTIGEIQNKGYSLNTLIKEIKKCNVMCANCHRKLHYNRKRKRKRKVANN